MGARARVRQEEKTEESDFRGRSAYSCRSRFGQLVSSRWPHHWTMLTPGLAESRRALALHTSPLRSCCSIFLFLPAIENIQRSGRRPHQANKVQHMEKPDRALPFPPRGFIKPLEFGVVTPAPFPLHHTLHSSPMLPLALVPVNLESKFVPHL